MKQTKYKQKGLSAETKKSTKVDNKENGSSASSVRKHPKLLLAGKVLVILAIVIGVVNHTDNKKYFEPNLSYHDYFTMPSFQKLIKTDTIDVCLFGNSHLGNGINTHMLSNSLGATCFTFFIAGCDLQDVYFMLLDVLSQTHIKVAVFETYTMTNAFSFESSEKNKFFAFKARTTPTKIKATPAIFDVEDYWAAWSNTIRNHEFIFRDTAQINRNKKGINFPPAKHIYLGDTGLNEEGIGDSLIAVYDSLGPIMDGALVKNDIYDHEYFEKIMNLCKEHGVKAVFLSIPEYHRNLKNYDKWKQVLSDMITPTGSPWIDFQANYDTTEFRKEFFQNERRVNQHVVYAGTTCFSTRLASYLKDSLQLGIPDRTKQKRWHDMFYATEGYYLQYSPRANDTICHTICDSLKIGPVLIQNAFWSKEQNVRGIYVKFDKSSFTKEQARKPIEMLMDGEYQGRTVRASFKIMPTDMFPVNNYLYKISVINDFTPKAIIGIKMSSSEAKAAIKN